MIHEGWRLAYQTPVGGYPWSIPFEFPIFQSITALISWVGNFNLDMVGRLLSFTFLIACAWPAFQIVKRLDLHLDTAWIFCVLFWSSPIYLFWGRAFMIETAAVFFTLAAIPYSLDLRDSKPCWSSAVCFAIFATLGLLQKVTTAAPVIVILGIVLAVSHYEKSGLRMPKMRKIACTGIAFAVPILIAVCWTKYTDLVKSENVFGLTLTSSALKKWNFGTLAQRFDLSLLKLLWHRTFINNAASFLGIMIIIDALIIGTPTVKRMLMVCLALFTLPILVFMNLHWVHDYYQVSCVVYLIGALAIALPTWARIGKYMIVPILTLLLAISNYYHFKIDYSSMVFLRPDVSSSSVLAVSDVIRRYTPVNSGIVIFGYDWSSEIVYYSERKGFTCPAWFNKYDLIWATPASFLGDKELGAIVFCNSDKRISLEMIMQRPDVKLNPRLFKVIDFYVWLPNAKSIVLPLSNRIISPISCAAPIYQ